MIAASDGDGWPGDYQPAPSVGDTLVRMMMAKIRRRPPGRERGGSTFTLTAANSCSVLSVHFCWFYKLFRRPQLDRA